MSSVATRERSPRVAAALAGNQRQVALRAAEAWRPRPVVRPRRWIPECVRLDPMIEAGGGGYDLDRRPWWKLILECVADLAVRSVSIAAATQVGKTLALIASILWCAENQPAPGMFIVPDRDTAIELRDRVYADALATIKSGKTTRIRVPKEHQWNTRYIDLGSMRVYLAWAGSRQRLRGRPCRYVWMTEVDVYKGDKRAGNPIAAGHQRTKAFVRGLHFHESSPVEAPSEICELERQAAARYRWQCPCPHCGRFQEPRFFVHSKGPLAGRGGFGGLKDPQTGEHVSMEQARERAHYVCENGCRIESGDKQAWLEAGRWVPYGCTLERGVDGADGQVTWEIKGRQPASRRSVGFHLWSLHSEAISFGDIAEQYIQAIETGKLAEFFGNWLGLEFKRQTRLPHWQELGRKLAWTHSRCSVPAEAWFLTAGADVQGENNGVRYAVRAWGPERTSWLVDWGWIDREEGDDAALVKSDLVKLEAAILRRTFPIAGEAKSVWGRRDMRVKLLCVDSNHLPMKVHAWLRSLPAEWVYSETPRVRAIRGDHQLRPETRWRYHLVESNTRTGEKYEGGLPQWGIYVYPFYDELTGALSAEPGKPGAWYVTADALTLGKNYLEQVVNFGRSIKFDDKTGQKKAVWGPINGRVPIDFWDCEIYDLVAAQMVVGDLGWSPQAWEQHLRSRRGQGPGASGQEPVRPQNDDDLGAR